MQAIFIFLFSLMFTFPALAADINSALLAATENGDITTVQAMLDNGADVNARDEDGATALILAACTGRDEVLEILLDNGADVNAQEKDGNTALMMAAFFGDVSTLQLLLDTGADIDIKAKDGATALTLAESEGHEDIVEILIRQESIVNNPDKENEATTTGAKSVSGTSFKNFSPDRSQSPALLVPAVYSTIQAAINAARDGDIVRVGDGTYSENINFKNKAITVQSVNGAEFTIIDGSQSDSDGSTVTFSSGETASSILEGFSIQKGLAYSGGGIYFSESSPTIRKCIIRDNGAKYGGGIACYASSSPEITNCVIAGNTSSSTGGGIYLNDGSSPTIINCSISDNSAAEGGGIYCLANSSPTVINSIFWGNIADEAGNEILLLSNSSITITYSDIEGGWTGIGNIGDDPIDDNPLFVDPGLGNYRLQADSPCIDTGTGDTITYPGIPGDDIAGTIRPQEGDGLGAGTTGDGSDYDMGAYELHDCFPSPEVCDGIDNNCDGRVDEDNVCSENATLQIKAQGCSIDPENYNMSTGSIVANILMMFLPLIICRVARRKSI